jgi:hypothetical protein
MGSWWPHDRHGRRARGPSTAAPSSTGLQSLDCRFGSSSAPEREPHRGRIGPQVGSGFVNGAESGESRDLRLHRGLVQPAPPALHARLPLPNRVRTPARRARRTSARGPDSGPRIGRGHPAEGLRRAHNASPRDGRLRFRCQRLDRSRERSRRRRQQIPPGPRRTAIERRGHPLVSPPYGHGQAHRDTTSTTTATRVV